MLFVIEHVGMDMYVIVPQDNVHAVPQRHLH